MTKKQKKEDKKTKKKEDKKNKTKTIQAASTKGQVEVPQPDQWMSLEQFDGRKDNFSIYQIHSPLGERLSTVLTTVQRKVEKIAQEIRLCSVLI